MQQLTVQLPASDERVNHLERDEARLEGKKDLARVWDLGSAPTIAAPTQKQHWGFRMKGC
jgi:hypothetical protein